jgi:hypothetical protein
VNICASNSLSEYLNQKARVRRERTAVESHGIMIGRKLSCACEVSAARSLKAKRNSGIMDCAGVRRAARVSEPPLTRLQL